MWKTNVDSLCRRSAMAVRLPRCGPIQVDAVSVMVSTSDYRIPTSVHLTLLTILQGGTRVPPPFVIRFALR